MAAEVSGVSGRERSLSWDWSDEDRVALADFLERHELCSGPIATMRIGEGHSNLTFLVSDGDRKVVVRRGPPPPIPAGAHDMLRESALISALSGTTVPVPRSSQSQMQVR